MPGGEHFELRAAGRGPYLRHRSTRWDFVLASDSAVPTFDSYRRMENITS